MRSKSRHQKNKRKTNLPTIEINASAHTVATIGKVPNDEDSYYKITLDGKEQKFHAEFTDPISSENFPIWLGQLMKDFDDFHDEFPSKYECFSEITLRLRNEKGTIFYMCDQKMYPDYAFIKLLEFINQCHKERIKYFKLEKKQLKNSLQLFAQLPTEDQLVNSAFGGASNIAKQYRK